MNIHEFRVATSVLCLAAASSALMAEDTIVAPAAPQAVDLVSRSAWVLRGERRPPAIPITLVTTHHGKETTLHKLLDRPAVVTFFHTRCTNARKCCSAISRIADLQKKLADTDLHGRVRVIAITYEPQHDTPERLNGYAKSFGVQPDDNTVMVRVKSEEQTELMASLDVPVSYNDGWVNRHGIYLLIVDADGRIARKYHTVVWDNEDILNDLRTLAGEKG